MEFGVNENMKKCLSNFPIWEQNETKEMPYHTTIQFFSTICHYECSANKLILDIFGVLQILTYMCDVNLIIN